MSKNLIAVSKWNEYHDFPTVGALRNLIFYADKNGINQCLRKIGGRLYIEESEFFNWVDEENELNKNRGSVCKQLLKKNYQI